MTPTRIQIRVLKSTIRFCLADPADKRGNLPLLSHRPIIGAVALDKSTKLSMYYDDFESHVVSSYVKFAQQGGARVVPIHINRDDAYYDKMFKSTNGLILQGGSVLVNDSDYQRAVEQMYKRALASPDYYPIWGTCLGFEQLLIFQAKMEWYLEDCHAHNMPLKLNLNPKYWSQSLLGRSMPNEIKQILTEEEITYNNHNRCVTPRSFLKHRLDEFWTPLASNYDSNGLEFYSLVEAKTQPFWGLHFHPEKIMYEWSKLMPNIPHSLNAIRAASYLAEFFVQECRKNDHGFESRKEEEEHLIDNYKNVFSGRMEIDFKHVNVYLL
eukprot:snap_masked-scaffold175_size286436-processed-gene-1.34 protein:Tk09299 transcript:snap_masked-scaffold175_size286436-processed-gene-1.34-mRNA-1 annotation:"gamma-glutamyl hydrolase precursor"